LTTPLEALPSWWTIRLFPEFFSPHFPPLRFPTPHVIVLPKSYFALTRPPDRSFTGFPSLLPHRTLKPIHLGSQDSAAKFVLFPPHILSASRQDAVQKMTFPSFPPPIFPRVAKEIFPVLLFFHFLRRKRVLFSVLHKRASLLNRRRDPGHLLKSQ